jgi:hypothetical protein
MIAAVFNIDGTGGFIDFEEDTLSNLIRETVGGYFDSIRLSKLGVTMWIHDEGKLLNMEPNPFATLMWNSEYGPTDVIVGNMLLTGPIGPEGEALGLPAEFVELLSTALHGPEGCEHHHDHELEQE